MFENEKDPKQRNRLLIAVGISALILIGFNVVGARFFGMNAPAKPAITATADTAAATPAAAVPGAVSQTLALPQDISIAFGNERATAAVNLRGGRIDQLTLKNYRTEVTEKEGFPLLKSTGDHAEYVAGGWMGNGIEGPGENAQWQLEADVNAPGKPLVMVWRNATGQAFQRTIAARPDSYLFDVTDTMVNSAAMPVTVTPYVQVHRADGHWANERPSWVNFFGPMGVTLADGSYRLHEDKYDSLKKERQSEDVVGSDGWWGITSQYFMVAVLPGSVDGKDVPSTRVFRYAPVDAGNGTQRDIYSASVSWPGVTVPAGATTTVTYSLYAGPKHYQQLKAADHGLDRAISWGWFEPLVKGLYAVLLWLYTYLHNWGFAVMALTLLLKIVTFPLANKSYHSMAKMKKLQPQIEELKARHKDDQQALAMATMQLYKKAKVNPLSGCWPMLIQIPIFFAMYKVVLVMFEFRHAPLGLWIHDMSTYDPYYVLPVLMGISMFVQFKLNPAPTDPTQAMMFKWMPAIMTFVFLHFPAGLVLYWLTNNVLSICQQAFIMRKDKAI